MKYKILTNKCRGFTLIEIMMVVLIIGILLTVSVPLYSRYINSSKCVDAEVAAHDTMLALARELADSGTAPSSSSYANSHTLPSGETLAYPTNVEVKFSGSGTQADPFVVNAKRSNPTCPKGDGEYTLIQGQTTGIW